MPATRWTEADGADLRRRVAAMLESAWRSPGFCVPNAAVYPHQWLWDSCFHSVVWAELGDERAVVELENALAKQEPSGFVPHMTYWSAPGLHADFWGRPDTSSITQPPMFGHAIAELVRRGFDVSESAVQRAVDGLRHLVRDRSRTPNGLVPVVHPWETGCDDSARWDSWRAADPSIEAWREQKAAIVADLGRGLTTFEVGSIGFNALLVWNARELQSIGVDVGGLERATTELGDAIAGQWDDDRETWCDDGDHASRSVRTADALLALLVDPRAEVIASLVHRAAFGSEHGVRGVHPDEPSYEPGRYWRGGVWPQLCYLLAVAAERAGHPSVAVEVADGLRRGAVESGCSEYWHPDTGASLGARPQTWAGLAIVV